MSVNSVTKAIGDQLTAAQLNALRLDILTHGGDILTDTGATNAYIVTCDNQITSLVAGQKVTFIAANANTLGGGSTLRYKNSLALDTTHDLTAKDGTQLQPGEIPSGGIVIAEYNATSTRWEVQGLQVGRYGAAYRNLKATEIVIEYKQSEMTKSSSSANLRHYEYMGESSMDSSSADDLMAVYRNLTQFGGSTATMPATAIPFSMTNAWRNGGSSYTQGFFGFRSAIDCPGATDTAHHAGFIMDGTSLYASVGNGTTQTKSANLGYTAGISVYQVYKVEYDGTDWNFYIDGTKVATLTTNKPTINNLTKMFLGIDSNNSSSQTIWYKNIFVFTSRFQ